MDTLLIRVLKWLEYGLMALLVVSVLVFGFVTVETAFQLDWNDSDTYFFVIKRIMALAIGIELIRFILTYHLTTLLEILIFLIARQLIHMEIESNYTYLLPTVVGISLLIGLRVFIEHKPEQTSTTN